MTDRAPRPVIGSWDYPMSAEGVTSAMDLLVAQVCTLRAMRPLVEKIIRVCEHAEAVAPILDPSSFQSGAHRLRNNQKFLFALRSFLDAIETLRSEGSA